MLYRVSAPMPTSSHASIKNALSGFLDYMSAERRFSPGTVKKYREAIDAFVRDAGDLVLAEIQLEHFIALKARMAQRGVREARIGGVVSALKSMLTYARDVLGIAVTDLAKIKAPRAPRRQVIYLSNEELAQFISAIRLETSWTGQPRLAGYCFRALVETLAATAMRISEALSLRRGGIDLEKREARIVGKGNKERTVFFTERALGWIQRYLDLRKDSGEALFATGTGKALGVGSAEAMFRRISRRSRLAKVVTPHMMRHTAATNLLQKGCPIGFIKEVLGHQRLETTCHFYLGVLNKTETKEAFDRYMVYDSDQIPKGPFLPLADNSTPRDSDGRMSEDFP
jgi:integrase/recombinase XerC